MQRRKPGVAMLGAGSIAEYHLAGLAAAGADVRVVASRTAGKAQALAARFGIAEASDDVEGLLSRNDVHAVVVATPDATHEAIAIAAARAGKAILLQKPMAGSLAGAQRIVEAAQRHGIDLQVSFMHRFFEEVVAVRRWLHEGVVGRVLAVRLRNATPGPDWGAWFYRKASVPHGVADQLGVHGIDLVQQLLGPIASVSARARTALRVRRLADASTVDVETPDNVSAVYVLDDGTLVTHEMSMTEVAGCDRFRMEIYGEKGTLWLRTERGRLAAFAPERFGSDWHVPALADVPFGQRQHAAWLAGLDGSEAPLATAADAVQGMRVVEALMRSSEEGGKDVAVARDPHPTPLPLFWERERG